MDSMLTFVCTRSLYRLGWWRMHPARQEAEGLPGPPARGPEHRDIPRTAVPHAPAGGAGGAGARWLRHARGHVRHPGGFRPDYADRDGHEAQAHERVLLSVLRGCPQPQDHLVVSFIRTVRHAAARSRLAATFLAGEEWDSWPPRHCIHSSWSCSPCHPPMLLSGWTAGQHEVLLGFR